MLVQADMATLLFNLHELTLATLNDNVATVSWNQKGSITLDHWRHHCYHHEVSHIAGEANGMADILS